MRIHIREPIVFLHFHVWLTERERDVIAFLLETSNVFISSEFLISCFLDQCAFTCNTVSLEMPLEAHAFLACNQWLMKLHTRVGP